MGVKVINKNVEKALRKLKKVLDREGTLKDSKRRRFYEKPSDKRYRKNKKAKYAAKMQSLEDRLW